MTVTDEREHLIQDICLGLAPFLNQMRDVKDMLYMLMEPYEITNRSTELTLLDQNRNENLMKRFLIAKTVKGCTPKTIHMYEANLRFILEKIGKTVDDITADDIRYYLAVRQRKDGISKVTADTELRVLRTFFQYLLTEELITKNPTARVERIRCERRRKDALTGREVELMRMAAHGERERTIIEVLLSTGCRISELAQMKLDDMDGNKILVHGKGEKDRIVYLNDRAMVTVETYLKKRKDMNPYLFAGGIFQSVKYRGKRREMHEWWQDADKVTADTHLDIGTIEALMRKIAKRAGVTQANPHKFRRTCATMALRRGMPIEQVSKMLGHEQISTTQIYLDLSEEELEQMHNKYVV